MFTLMQDNCCFIYIAKLDLKYHHFASRVCVCVCV